VNFLPGGMVGVEFTPITANSATCCLTLYLRCM
jgi:hypothetical protein